MAKNVELRVVKDDNGKNVLHFAAAHGHLEMCKFLIDEWGFDVNSLALEGVSLVLMAVCSGSIPVLQYVLDRGGEPAMATSMGTMPLHEAVVRGNSEAAMLLLSKGVPVESLDCHGMPLLMAVGKDREKIAKVLLEHGADSYPSSIYPSFVGMQCALLEMHKATS